jgi:hypothetical protein
MDSSSEKKHKIKDEPTDETVKPKRIKPSKEDIEYAKQQKLNLKQEKLQQKQEKKEERERIKLEKRAQKTKKEKKTRKDRTKEELDEIISKRTKSYARFKEIISTGNEASNSKYQKSMVDADLRLDSMQGNPRVLANEIYNLPSVSSTHTYEVEQDKMRLDDPETYLKNIEAMREKSKATEYAVIGDNAISDHNEEVLGNQARYNAFYHSFESAEQETFSIKDAHDQMQNCLKVCSNIRAHLGTNNNDDNTYSNTEIDRQRILQALKGASSYYSQSVDESAQCIHNADVCYFSRICRLIQHPLNPTGAIPGICFRNFPHDENEMSVQMQKDMPRVSRTLCAVCQIFGTYDLMISKERSCIVDNCMLNSFRVKIGPGQFTKDSVFCTTSVFGNAIYARLNDFQVLLDENGKLHADGVPRLRAMWPVFQ